MPGLSEPLPGSDTAPGVRRPPGDVDHVGEALRGSEALRRALLEHHPIARTDTGPLAGCRCGQVKPGQDVIDHVIGHIVNALARPAVDTVEDGARAMFRVTNRADSWSEPSIPEDLREHYRRLARAVLEAAAVSAVDTQG